MRSCVGRPTFRTRKDQVEAVAGIVLAVIEGEVFGFLGSRGGQDDDAHLQVRSGR